VDVVGVPQKAKVGVRRHTDKAHVRVEPVRCASGGYVEAGVRVNVAEFLPVVERSNRKSRREVKRCVKDGHSATPHEAVEKKRKREQGRRGGRVEKDVNAVYGIDVCVLGGVGRAKQYQRITHSIGTLGKSASLGGR
jgi:hypothetical protein